MNKKYFHEVWPQIEDELAISFEMSKINAEERRKTRKQRHMEKRKGAWDPRTFRSGKRK